MKKVLTMNPNCNTHTIACGSCKIPAECVANPKPNDDVTCPRCNRRDRFDDVMAAVKKHILHMTKKQLNERIRRATSGNSFVKFETKPLGNPNFRWIALGF